MNINKEETTPLPSAKIPTQFIPFTL